ncbi:Fc receptor-like protein 5 [Lepus europaeus]|uniref:Fc receptor-like protein 5 n=1 Tax=Lepus europaeus TaxID=9983 RepID=UPI002B498E38|nr:Fc receptor-like protein 5 [Lepus europaeus]
MLLWAILLVLASIRGQFATTPKPFVSLHPPWTVNFEGETVNLTCNGFHPYSPRKTVWYHKRFGAEMSREIPGNTFLVHESGDYRCQAKGSASSDSVHLIFSKAPLILQAPLAIFEGDSVVLRCKSKAEVAMTTKTIKKNNQHLERLDESPEFHIRHASLKDNGDYQCTGHKQTCCAVSSNAIKIQVLELFPRPVLAASSFQPIDGSPVTLTCKTQLPPQKSHVQLQFRFFRDSQTLETDWRDSPELQIPAMWIEDSGSYWCKAGTMSSLIWKESTRSRIQVQRAAPNIQIRTVPTAESVFEGQELVLICSVEGVPGPITVSWYKLLNKRSKRTKIQDSQEAEFKIHEVANSDAGEYFCIASNSRRSYTSIPITINVRVPVSQPVLTLSTVKSRIVEGDTVIFRCEAQRGSLPILYQIFRENVFLKKIEVTSWKRSVSFSLTAEHSGNYYCIANNGLKNKSSQAVSLSITVPVSFPVLTLSTAEGQALEGDLVTLHCEAWRGSLPIQYQFFHKDVSLERSLTTSGGGASFSFSATTEHSGNYYCTANNGFGIKNSKPVSLSITVPVSRPILTLKAPRTTAVVGDVVELHCEAIRGSPPILYRFYHENVILGSISAPTGGGASFNLSLTAEHSGNYSCEADNGPRTQHSDTVSLSVTVPVSRPVLTLRAPRAQAVVGDVVELHCETPRGSPPILYRFYHEGVTLGNSSAPSGGGASFNLSLTAEHSGNYSCEASNTLGAQQSEMVTLKVTVPVSRPVLALRVLRAQVVVGDVVELHCETPRGSPPILYRFYHEDVTLGSSSAPSGGGASFNLSLTAEHSGNYSCEADNGVGTERSEVVTLSISGLTENRSGPVATGVTGALLSIAGLAAGALLFHCWLSRKTERKPASNPSRNSSDSDPQEPTYHNVPAWIELQPVYSNVNPRGSDVVYTEVRRIQGETKPTEDESVMKEPMRHNINAFLLRGPGQLRTANTAQGDVAGRAGQRCEAGEGRTRGSGRLDEGGTELWGELQEAATAEHFSSLHSALCTCAPREQVEQLQILQKKMRRKPQKSSERGLKAGKALHSILAPISACSQGQGPQAHTVLYAVHLTPGYRVLKERRRHTAALSAGHGERHPGATPEPAAHNVLTETLGEGLEPQSKTINIWKTKAQAQASTRERGPKSEETDLEGLLEALKGKMTKRGPGPRGSEVGGLIPQANFKASLPSSGWRGDSHLQEGNVHSVTADDLIS